MSKLLELIAPEFVWLVAGDGVRVTESFEKSEVFGNSAVVVETTELKLRIYTDRAQRFVDVSGNGRDWHKLEYVLEFAEPACSQDWFGEPPDLGKLSAVLKRNIKTVSCLLADEVAASAFAKFEKQKSMELILRIFGKPT